MLLEWLEWLEWEVRRDRVHPIERLAKDGLEHAQDAPWLRTNIRSLDEHEQSFLPSGLDPGEQAA